MSFIPAFMHISWTFFTCCWLSMPPLSVLINELPFLLSALYDSNHTQPQAPRPSLLRPCRKASPRDTQMVLTQEEIDACRAAFQAMDRDRSGTIDVWQLRQVGGSIIETSIDGLLSRFVRPAHSPPHPAY